MTDVYKLPTMPEVITVTADTWTFTVTRDEDTGDWNIAWDDGEQIRQLKPLVTLAGTLEDIGGYISWAVTSDEIWVSTEPDPPDHCRPDEGYHSSPHRGCILR